MIKILRKLDSFLADLNIEYMVTGTTALYIAGFPSSYIPNDIDILVSELNPKQLDELAKQQYLAGLNNEDYPTSSKCFTFPIEGKKINVIIQNISKEYIQGNSNKVVLSDGNLDFCIRIQRVRQALESKMLLNQDKDKGFLIDAIDNLMDIYKCKPMAII